mgnify:CR=1 FL=1
MLKKILIFLIYMNIHPLWYVCITVRFSIIFAIKYLVNIFKSKKFVRYLLSCILLTMGLGFTYNGYTGSNNKSGFISKVFWHETRYLHGILHIFASLYLFNNNLKMNSLILMIDLIFSFLFRIKSNR